MSDLVARLRNWKHAAVRRDGSTLATMEEAAAEIEELRALLKEARQIGIRTIEFIYSNAENKARLQDAKDAADGLADWIARIDAKVPK